MATLECGSASKQRRERSSQGAKQVGDNTRVLRVVAMWQRRYQGGSGGRDIDIVARVCGGDSGSSVLRERVSEHQYGGGKGITPGGSGRLEDGRGDGGRRWGRRHGGSGLL